MSSQLSDERAERPAVAGTVRKFSVPIILGWLAITVIVSIGVPSLEQVAKHRTVSLSSKDAASVTAMTRMGELFKESNSDGVAMIVLEGKQPLGDDAHAYYDGLIRRLKADPTHVQHVQDFWGDPLTAPGAQSADGKAAYVQLNLAGNQGETLATESVDAVRKIVQQTPPPSGVKAYVTGTTPLLADLNHAGDKTVIKITVVSVAVIFMMLLLVYRSFSTTLLLLAMVGIELAVVRGIAAFLGDLGIIRLSTFAVNILVPLALAAGTDYGIFFIGRYHEARQAGQDRETAYYTSYRGVAHVVLASGLTIAGATYCLSFTRLPIFQTMGVPCALGMLVATVVALTLIPAGLTVSSRFGLLDPKRTIKVRGWRRVGTAIVRWPAPIFVATCAVTLVGLLILPGYRASYRDRLYIPKDIPANMGWAAAERHFSQARMMPEILMIESDHDMRNPADFLVLDKLAKGIFRVPGISRVQAVTRPEGKPLQHTSIPYLLSVQTAGQLQNMKFAKERANDMVKVADELGGTITAAERMHSLMQQLTGTTHDIAGVTKDTVAITGEVRDHIADFDDAIRPFRKYLYSNKHCYDFTVCGSLRSVSDALDGVDKLTEKLQLIGKDANSIDAIAPQLLELLPPQIATMKTLRTMLLGMHSTVSGMFDQMDELSGDAMAMGKDFDAAKNDDSFYLPREVFNNPEFQRVMKLFLSPDGKAARFIILHRGDPATAAGISRVDSIKTAAEESLKGTPLEDANIYLAGAASIFKDMQEGSNYDLMIAGISSLCMIFIIMLIITQSLVGALVIVGTVLLSLGASLGLSVLVWQYLIGFDLHWLVLVMSVIILLAVGSDYNLLLVSRFKEEIGAGLKTGIIRGMGGTGKVVTAAGLVFAFTMAAMVVSDLRVVGQVGTTIGLGLLFDTLVVRSLLMPSIAALLGRWFWWPMNVGSRAASRVPTRPARDDDLPVAHDDGLEQPGMIEHPVPAMSGSRKGSANGSANGSSNGAANGSSNGSSNGAANGSSNGSSNRAANGSTPGAFHK
jgi:RND superfamily putative drug exporter